MEDSEVIIQALAGLVDTEFVAKQLEQAFKDVSTFSSFNLHLKQ